jgi:hypothetical protein
VFISKGAEYRHVPAWRKTKKGFTGDVAERGWVLSEGADVALSENFNTAVKIEAWLDV